VFFRQRNFERALVNYTTAIENRRATDRTDLLPHTRRGLALCQLGRFNEAIAEFRASYDESPKPSLNLLETVVRGNFLVATPLDKQLHEPIAELFDRYVTDQKRSSAARLYAVDRLAEIKLYEAARKHLEADESAGPSGWGTRYRLALLALRRRDEAEYGRICRSALADALATRDEKVSGFTIYPSILAPGALKDYGSAIDFARRALAIQPGSALYRFVLGGLLLRAGQFEEASQRLRASLEAKEDNQGESVFGPYLLAVCCHYLDRKDEAHRWLRQGDQSANDAPYFNWRFQLVRQTLSREANLLINPPANPSPPTGKD
jgi:tetratricopeptide (TPR) repeat protein